MTQSIWYYNDTIQQIIKSSFPEDEIDLAVYAMPSNIYFLLDDDYYAVYFQNGKEYRDWFGSAVGAFDFLMLGERRGKLSATSIILPSGVEVKAPWFGGDRGEWEALGR